MRIEEDIQQNSFPVDMGFNVMVARKAVKKTQKEVAAALEMDVKTMERLEQKKVIPDYLLTQISQILHCDVDFLKNFSVEKEMKTNIVENNTQEVTSAENARDQITQNQVGEQENIQNGISIEAYDQRMEQIIGLTKELAVAQTENAFLKSELEKRKEK